MKNNMFTNQSRCKYFITFYVCVMISHPTFAAEDWDFMIEGYISFSSIEGDAGIGRVTGVAVDVDFNTILENLELGGMIHAEAFHESGWGLIADYGFMSLGSGGILPVGGVVDADVRQGVFQSYLTRRMDLENNILDLYAGIRWWDNDIDVNIIPAILPGTITTGIEQDWVDLVIGVRLFHPVTDKWVIQFIGDIGGVTGADFTATLAAGAQYKWKERWTVDLQYKALWVDYQDGTPGTPGYFAYDTVTHGPLIGIIYNF